MTKDEWLSCDDASAMLEFLWEGRADPPNALELRFGGNMVGEASNKTDAFDRALHRYYVACCRGIWALLPQEASRRGVELAEQYLAGQAAAEEVSRFNWDVEGAAFCIDYSTSPERIEGWVADVRAMPEAELKAMLHPPGSTNQVEPRELLLRAAYFVDFAMIYPSLRPKGLPPGGYRPFLSAGLLRTHVAYPGTTG